MNRKLSVLFMLSFFISAAAALAAQPSEPAEPLKSLEWLVGEWEGEEFVWPADIGPFRKGDRGSTTGICHWSLDRRILVAEFFHCVNGKRVPGTHEVTTWDPAKKKPVMNIVAAEGMGSGEWVRYGDTCEIAWTFEDSKTKHKGTSFLEKTGPDTYVWEWRYGGEKTAETPKVVYHRKKGAAAGELWQSFGQAAVGVWSGTAPMLEDSKEMGLPRGAELQGGTTLKPDLDGKALVGEMHFKAGDRPLGLAARILVGWDPNARQVRYLMCWNGGMMEELQLDHRQGKAFLGSYVRKAPDATSWRAAIRLEYPDPDNCVATFLDGPYKGKTLSTWKRQKGNPAPASGRGPSKAGKATASREDFLEWGRRLEGEWNAKLTIVLPIAGTKHKPGDIVDAKVTYRWLLGKQALEEIESMPGLESRRIHRWDESARKIKSDNIDTSGGIFTVAFGRQGDQWPWTAEVKTSDGATVQGEGVNALTADGQYLVQGELTINGVKVSALRNVYQKVKNEPFR